MCAKIPPRPLVDVIYHGVVALRRVQHYLSDTTTSPESMEWMEQMVMGGGMPTTDGGYPGSQGEEEAQLTVLNIHHVAQEGTRRTTCPRDHFL